SAIQSMPPAKAKKLLLRFPMIGEPGAEKILMRFGMLTVLAVESNGLRVLIRLGIGQEAKNYAATYRSARDAATRDLAADSGVLERAYLLLRRHGQELCLRSGPVCESCPIHANCPSSQVGGVARGRR